MPQAPWEGRIGILADPHLHATGTAQAYGYGDTPLLRSLPETLHSTRVFNESEPALRAALNGMVAEGIKLVLIVGDLTDDGQEPNWQTAAEILRDYEVRAGMRFFLTPGNHDQWVTEDFAQTKGFTAADGTDFTISSAQGSANTSPAMQRLSYAQIYPIAAAFGYAPRPQDLLWETPFGSDPALAARGGTIDAPPPVQTPDLSYLVEPEEGLWILSIDASVYWPDPASSKGGWVDGSSEGWAAVLTRKAWLLDWIADVSARATAQGKRLVTFSHFPVLDALNGASGQMDAGGTRRKMPDAAQARTIAETGMGLHFSGHWHLNRSTSRLATPDTPALINIATPSTVAYPAGWKAARFHGHTADVTTHLLRDVAGHDLAHAAYRMAGAELPEASDYQSFLRWHLTQLITERYLPRDWEAGFGNTLRSATIHTLIETQGGTPCAQARDISGVTAMIDLYLLERAGSLADIPQGRLELYRDLKIPDTKGAAGRLLTTLKNHASGAPDTHFRIDLQTGTLAAL